MKRSLKTGAAVTAALALIGGGIAYAYYTDSAIQYATAKVNNPTGSLSVSVTVDGDAMSPGGAGQTITWTATNNSTTTVTLTSATIQILGTDGQPWYVALGCSASDFEFVDSAGNVHSTAYGYTQSLGGVEVAPGGSASSATTPLTIRMINHPYNQNGCKNADVPIYVNVG